MLSAERFEIARLVSSIFATAGLFRTNIRFRVSSKEPAGSIPFLLLAPQVAIIFLSVAAVIFGIWRQIADPENALTLWLALLIMALAGVNVYLCLRVVADTVRTARAGERTYRHVLPLPFRIRSGPLTGKVFTTDELSTREIVFEPDADCAFKVGDRLSAELFLPGHLLPVDAVVERIESRGGRSRVLIGLMWGASAGRDRLDLALHAGRWYRPIVGYRESVRTPYDVLKDFMDTGRLGKPTPPIWKPAICRVTDAGFHREALCYVTESLGSASGGPALILFGHVEAGTRIAINLVPRPNSGSGLTHCTVETEIVGLLHDEAALQAAGGTVYIIDPIARADVVVTPTERSAQILRLPGS